MMAIWSKAGVSSIETAKYKQDSKKPTPKEARQAEERIERERGPPTDTADAKRRTEKDKRVERRFQVRLLSHY